MQLCNIFLAYRVPSDSSGEEEPMVFGHMFSRRQHYRPPPRVQPQPAPSENMEIEDEPQHQHQHPTQLNCQCNR